MDAITRFLEEFEVLADDWFEASSFLVEHYRFFQEFFRPERLSRAEWEDFQELGQNIHAFKDLPLARAKAFGEPNHSIERYRASFEYLARGDDPLPTRLDRLMKGERYKLAYLGESAIGEIAGELFAEDYLMYNGRALEALEMLGLQPAFERGDSFGTRFVKLTEAAGPLVRAYENVVGPRTEVPIYLEVDQFLNWLYQERDCRAQVHQEPAAESSGETRPGIWLIAPGRDAARWDEFVELGLIGIGWDEAGDLTRFGTVEEVQEELEALYGKERAHIDARACYEFAHDMRAGDLVFVKRGRTEVLGVGRVASAYRFDEARPQFKHVRDVEWLRVGEWTTHPRTRPRGAWSESKKKSGAWREEPRMLPMKALTEITGYAPMRAELEILVGIDAEVATGRRAPLPVDRELLDRAVEQFIAPAIEAGVFEKSDSERYHHQVLIPAAQPYLWRASIEQDPRAAVRGAITARMNNLLSHYEKSKVLDFVDRCDPAALGERLVDLLYDSGPLAERVEAFLEWGGRRDGPDGNTIGFNGTAVSYLLAMHAPAQHAFCKPTVYEEAVRVLLGDEHVLSDEAARIEHATRLYGEVVRQLRAEYGLPVRDLMHVHALFYLLSRLAEKRPAWNDFREEDRTTGQVPPSPTPAPYTLEDALEGLFYDRRAVSRWKRRLEAKRNVILQGPPGVGKTFVAGRLARLIMGYDDPARIKMVQFHQSYTYEDFIQGYRPARDGGFVLRNGVFYEFCRQARKDADRRHVFIIDEINRDNLSKIFGELMMLIETDKRGPEHAIPLTYAEDDAPPFYVPENLYLIGMMNTADRSLAMVDYALRRRFAFITMTPRFSSERFQAFLRERGASDVLTERIVCRMTALNEVIEADDANLGPGFCIGHSYFCPGAGETPDAAWYRQVVESEIAPLLREYWFDDAAKAEREIGKLNE